VTFVPARWLSNPHWMTVYGSVARLPPRVSSARERWELPDGDFLDVDRVPAATPDAPLVIICHGLEGSSRSGYVLGLALELTARGLGVVALNFRGCSGELNRLARFYHSGETGDLAHVVRRIAAERPRRALGLAGFSLGGNVVAKYLAERDVPDEVRAAAVVSVPFDLGLCCRAIDGPGFFPFVYRERFLRRLRKKAVEKASRFPRKFDVPAIRAARTLRGFDDVVTAPLHGFADAMDYYTRSSSGPLLARVNLPLFILHAEDDPLIPREAIPAERDNPHLTWELHAAGGHVGFVSGPPWRPHRFAEARVAEVLAARLRSL
jgi:predicted alpha/beta-fold hydrolase